MAYTLSDFEPLITRAELDQRIKELGHEITAGLERPEQLVVVGVLKGALVFMADLIRHLPPAITCGALHRRAVHIWDCPGPVGTRQPARLRARAAIRRCRTSNRS